jgi:hypothetical protein
MSSTSFGESACHRRQTPRRVSLTGIRPPERCPTCGALALAVTGFVIAEKCGDQLCVDIGGDHSMSFRLSAATREGFWGALSEHFHRRKQRAHAPEE